MDDIESVESEGEDELDDEYLQGVGKGHLLERVEVPPPPASDSWSEHVGGPCSNNSKPKCIVRNGSWVKVEATEGEDSGKRRTCKCCSAFFGGSVPFPCTAILFSDKGGARIFLCSFFSNELIVTCFLRSWGLHSPNIPNCWLSVLCRRIMLLRVGYKPVSMGGWPFDSDHFLDVSYFWNEFRGFFVGVPPNRG